MPLLKETSWMLHSSGEDISGMNTNQSKVLSLLQEPVRQFLWLGHPAGLLAFDGEIQLRQPIYSDVL